MVKTLAAPFDLSHQPHPYEGLGGMAHGGAFGGLTEGEQSQGGGIWGGEEIELAGAVRLADQLQRRVVQGGLVLGLHAVAPFRQSLTLFGVTAAPAVAGGAAMQGPLVQAIALGDGGRGVASEVVAPGERPDVERRGMGPGFGFGWVFMGHAAIIEAG